MQRRSRAAAVPSVVIIALCVMAACSRPRPSPEYERAREQWTELVRTHPQNPADDPRADEVLALLQRVQKESLDSAAATSLRERIETERREAADERARREGLVAKAAVPTPPLLSAEPAVRDRGAAPAPAPVGPELTPGMKLDAFRAAFGPCFESAGPVQVEAPGAAPRPGEMWVMKDDQGCREAHGRFVGQAVLFVNETLAGISPLKSMKRVEVRREVQLGVLPDGGTGMVVDGGVVPLPPGTKLLPSAANAGTPSAPAGGTAQPSDAAAPRAEEGATAEGGDGGAAQ